MTEPREFIRIQPLANGYRIDIFAEHSGVTKQLEPVHQPTRELAERYAQMFCQASGLPIVIAEKAGRR